MSQTSIALEQSLLDEDEFMAELGNLERGLTSSRPRGQATNPRPVALDFRAGPRKPGMFVEDEPVAGQADDVAPARPTLMWRLTATAMFVFMMGVGAAGAAAVFHERVARIVASWQ
jgi:hypothetical protein